MAGGVILRKAATCAAGCPASLTARKQKKASRLNEASPAAPVGEAVGGNGVEVAHAMGNGV